jgi:hypothetical protein
MTSDKHITLTTTSPSGTTSTVSIDIKTIKKIIERMEGSRLYILPDPTKPQVQLDVLESADQVKNLIIQAK